MCPAPSSSSSSNERCECLLDTHARKDGAGSGSDKVGDRYFSIKMSFTAKFGADGKGKVCAHVVHMTHVQNTWQAADDVSSSEWSDDTSKALRDAGFKSELSIHSCIDD